MNITLDPAAAQSWFILVEEVKVGKKQNIVLCMKPKAVQKERAEIKVSLFADKSICNFTLNDALQLSLINPSMNPFL